MGDVFHDNSATELHVAQAQITHEDVNFDVHRLGLICVSSVSVSISAL